MQIALFAAPESAGIQRYIGRCRVPDCRRTVAVESSDRTAEVLRDCPAGHGRIALVRVVGTLSSCPCDPRCTGAQGPLCECSCGGANHGRGWTI